MVFQPVLNTAQVNVIYDLNNQQVENVFYGEFPGGYDQVELDALAVRMDLRVRTNFLPQQPPEAVYQRVEVRGLEFENDLIATFSAGPAPGVQPTAALPNNVTLSIKQSSGFTGRSARGRTYFIGIPQGTLLSSDESFLNPAYVGAVVVALGEIRTGIESLPGWNAVLVSRISNGVPRAFGKTFPWISETAINDRVDSQRGRLPKV